MPDPTAAAAAARSSKVHPEANYKETIESILVAFILAFIFRAFVVEAFVIPTGSMAPTLYGAHKRFACPDCGYTFDVGYRAANSPTGDDVDIPATAKRTEDVRCPNCAFVFTGGENTFDPVRFGDRILVLKYLYLFQKPVRWDVVVFKAPPEGQHHVPEDAEYGQNYIKRLIGNPNESIVILDGDIYVGPTTATGPNDPWQIQRKPKYVQDALWRVVYDNDFPPQNTAARRNSGVSPDWVQPWQLASGGGWTLAGEGGKPSRIFTFDNTGGSGRLAFNPDANRSTPALRNWLAYDQLEGKEDGNWVGDLKVTAFYTRTSGAGPLRLQLARAGQCYTAELTPGKATLYRSDVAAASESGNGKGFDAGKLEPIASHDLPELAGSAPVRIDFINCDYRASLRINGVEVLAHDYAPNVPKIWASALADHNGGNAVSERPEIHITADAQACRLEHLSLARDIYYGNQGSHTDYLGNRMGPFWASPENPIHLGPGEYFVLGDNSQISGDARYWGDPIRLPHEDLPFVEGGRVPERFMLGKAFFVYWPAGYRLPFIPVNAVPDFGEMRFIR